MKWYEWLTATVIVGLLVALLLPQRDMDYPSFRRVSRDRAKMLGIALHNHQEAFGHLPPGAVRDAEGRAVHGWMTPLLPQVEHSLVLDRIQLEQPWDAEVNAEAMRTDIRTYRNPAIEQTRDAEGRALAHYAANSFVISAHDPMRFEDVHDGLAHTFLAGEVNGDFLAWGHPLNFRDPTLGLNAVPHGFGAPWEGGGVNMLLGDGRVHWFPDDTAPPILRALATPDGAETFDPTDVGLE